MNNAYCHGCGKEINQTTKSCPNCGAPQHQSSEKSDTDIPDGIKGWSWGAFLLNWAWAIGNKTWIGLLAFVPFVGLIIPFILGAKGREWAWRNKQWDSVEHFNAVQRKWSIWGMIVVGTLSIVFIAVAFIKPAHESHFAQNDLENAPPSPQVSQTNPNQHPFHSAPYSLPTLSFDKTDFVGAMKRAQIDGSWIASLSSYLSNPSGFWSDCVTKESAIAEEFGGMQSTEALAQGKASCQSIASQYRQCLDKKELGDAILCLHEYINNAENNGE